MAAELKAEYGVDVTFRNTQTGELEVIVNGKLIYSKLKTRRFPRPGEVIKLLKGE